jgi:hypothetical protein
MYRYTCCREQVEVGNPCSSLRSVDGQQDGACTAFPPGVEIEQATLLVCWDHQTSTSCSAPQPKHRWTALVSPSSFSC